MKDLKKVEILLNLELNIYVGFSVVKVLLLCVYLYMGNNKLVVEYVIEVIESLGCILLEGEVYVIVNVLVLEDNLEIIFVICCIKDKDDYGWNFIGGFYVNIDGVGWGELYVFELFWDVYVEYLEDLCL